MASVSLAERPILKKVQATLLYAEEQDIENDMAWRAVASSGRHQSPERTNSVMDWAGLIGLKFN